MHYSLLYFNPLFPAGQNNAWTGTKNKQFPAFKEFHANLKNVTTNRKKGIALVVFK
jgi:hypothetical protein